LKNNYVIIFILLILLVNLTGCFLFPPIGKPAEWTVMIYLDADNNLESAGIDDINEMEMVGSSSDVNIVVQADRILEYDNSNGDWTTTRRYYIKQDSNPTQINSELIEDLGELNMGDPETLIGFSSWAVNEYPAKKYLLVIWNHGGGFRSLTYNAKDIAWDETSYWDRITMPELETALLDITTQTGENIDIVGMDACFMAMTEVAYQIKDCGAGILVASEETEPFDGWPYNTILSQLVSNPTMPAEELASSIVDNYVNSYSSSYNAYNVTQSAVDLSCIGDLAIHLSIMAQAIIDDESTLPSDYIDAAYFSQHYSDFDFIDLYDFCDEVLNYSNNDTVKGYASEIKQTLENSVVINSDCYGPEVDSSNGLSIYFPATSYDTYYDNTDFFQDTLWYEMLSYLGY